MVELGTVSRGKTAVLLNFVQITSAPPPSSQFGKLVQFFSGVKIQDLKVSLELKTLYILYNILYIYNLKTVKISNYLHFGGNRLLLLIKNALI